LAQEKPPFWNWDMLSWHPVASEFGSSGVKRKALRLARDFCWLALKARICVACL
jgi:hypothetical protein